MELAIDFWMSKNQTEQSWRSLLFKVFHCVCHIFSCDFDKKFHKSWKKKIKQAKKFQTLDFAESNAHRKTNARGSFETYDLFFLA